MSTMEKVQEIIADALYVDAEEVKEDANLMRDLGAESIDFLDIVFRLEKEFNVKIPKGDIEKKAQGELGDEDFAIQGKITDAGLEQLRKALPEVKQSDIKSGLFVRDIPSLFTVRTFEKMVSEQLSESLDAHQKVTPITAKAVTRRGQSTINPEPLTGTERPL